MMESKPSPIARSLYAWEIQEARLVFGNQLQYDRVRVHEFTTWPNTLNRLGTRLKRMQYVEAPNAITLGNHCIFPIKLLDQLVSVDHPEYYKFPWLIHELTHIWQYQQLGWGYLFMSLEAQFRFKAEAYIFGGEQGLLNGIQRGARLADFNLEQQGEITRTYYQRLKQGQDVSAWMPFIEEIQQA